MALGPTDHSKRSESPAIWGPGTMIIGESLCRSELCEKPEASESKAPSPSASSFTNQPTPKAEPTGRASNSVLRYK